VNDEKNKRIINFQVTVDINIIPPIFTFYNSQQQATNGSVTVYCGEETHIVYHLSSPGFCFIQPAITNNFHGDVHYGVAEQGQRLIIVDQGKVAEDIGLQLIVEHVASGQRYASPDPQIRNIPS
jgi:hypothetical protein